MGLMRIIWGMIIRILGLLIEVVCCCLLPLSERRTASMGLYHPTPEEIDHALPTRDCGDPQILDIGFMLMVDGPVEVKRRRRKSRSGRSAQRDSPAINQPFF
jgi:hypothetical protein